MDNSILYRYSGLHSRVTWLSKEFSMGKLQHVTAWYYKNCVNILRFTGFNQLNPSSKWVIICTVIFINTFLLCVIQVFINRRSQILKLSCFILLSHQFISLMLVGMSLSQLLEIHFFQKLLTWPTYPSVSADGLVPGWLCTLQLFNIEIYEHSLHSNYLINLIWQPF